jgi:hypothetical protein
LVIGGLFGSFASCLGTNEKKKELNLLDVGLLTYKYTTRCIKTTQEFCAVKDCDWYGAAQGFVGMLLKNQPARRMFFLT